jgi:hypothetical protein
LQTTGGKTAEVTVLRLRQAFWLFAVGGCKPERYHSLLPFAAALLLFPCFSSPFYLSSAA